MTTDQCAHVLQYAVLDMIKHGWLVVGPELAKIEDETAPDDFGTPAQAIHFEARCKMYSELPYGFEEVEAKTTGLDFGQALAAMRERASVRRPGWSGQYLSRQTKPSTMLSLGDVLSDDWEIVTD